MLINPYEPGGRVPHHESISGDLVVVGGGLAGICCSITAARQGIRVILVQDRPVLGGNASSEVRLWALGATSHMGNNNRWAREGGVIGEILVENLWRNPEGNSVILDALLLEWVTREPNITLLLNTAVHQVAMKSPGHISSATAYCSQNETAYTLTAPIFCDSSGDGVLGYLSGAAYRMGAEAAAEFDEGLAGPEPVHELLGHSLYFYSRATDHPVKFVPPAFALMDIKKIPRYRELRVTDSGCSLWWLEYGGELDTVHGTEAIKWELWRVAYGVWNYIKNSGEFPEAANLTLEWIGAIPGKRESRRFVGDYILTQKDIVEQRTHFDAVSMGGWAIDIHPAKGVYSAAPPCTQWHAKGVYQIPLRCMYSSNIENLFLAGRILSASHIAFGSTRVMLTCAHNAQAVGMAAALCNENKILPRHLIDGKHLECLQQRLLRSGQHIPGVAACDPLDLARVATVTASSALRIDALPDCGGITEAVTPVALLVPCMAGPLPAITLQVDAITPATLRMEVWMSEKAGNYTPDVLLAAEEKFVAAGKCLSVEFRFDVSLDKGCHIFFIVKPASGISLHMSKSMLPGVLTLWQSMNRSVAKSAVQSPPPDSGIDSFAFWLPVRRPAARNLAASFSPAIECYGPSSVTNGWARPWCGANAWAPASHDPNPTLRLQWNSPQPLQTIEITFDTDFDHPMETVLMGHPERITPGCVTSFAVRTLEGQDLAHIDENHQGYWRLSLPREVFTNGIEIQILGRGASPPAIYEVRCY